MIGNILRPVLDHRYFCAPY